MRQTVLRSARTLLHMFAEYCERIRSDYRTFCCCSEPKVLRFKFVLQMVCASCERTFSDLVSSAFHEQCSMRFKPKTERISDCGHRLPTGDQKLCFEKRSFSEFEESILFHGRIPLQSKHRKKHVVRCFSTVQIWPCDNLLMKARWCPVSPCEENKEIQCVSLLDQLNSGEKTTPQAEIVHCLINRKVLFGYGVHYFSVNPERNRGMLRWVRRHDCTPRESVRNYSYAKNTGSCMSAVSPFGQRLFAVPRVRSAATVQLVLRLCGSSRGTDSHVSQRCMERTRCEPEQFWRLFLCNFTVGTELSSNSLCETGEFSKTSLNIQMNGLRFCPQKNESPRRKIAKRNNNKFFMTNCDAARCSLYHENKRE